MKKSFYLMAAALLTFTGCSNEELVQQVPNQFNTLTATIEQSPSDSRIVVTDNNTLAWSEGDAIRVFMKDPATNDPSYYDYVFTNGTFSPRDNGDPVPTGTTNDNVLGVYSLGADDNGDYSDGSIDENNDKKLNSGFSQNTVIKDGAQNRIILPMWGKWNDGAIAFKHLAGVLRINLSDLPDGYDLLTITSDEAISGTAYVDDVTVDNAVMVMENYPETGDHNIITVRFANAATRTLYVPLPVNESYGSIEVKVSKYDENLSEGQYKDPIILATYTDKEIKRGYIYTASPATPQVTGTLPTDVSSAISSGSNQETFILAGEVDATDPNAGSIAIPDNKEKTILDFQVTPKTLQDKPLKFESNTSSSSTDATQELDINMPSGAENLYVDINTPTATTTLNGGKYKEVKAKTATNTLIIKSGVVIESLKIEGGNVIIEEGATVTVESKPETSVVTTVVSTPEGLIGAINTGGNIKLANTIDLGLTTGTFLTIESGKTVNIDLNEQTLTTSSIPGDGTPDDITIKGTLTVKNGYVNTVNTAFFANGGTLTLTDCHVFTSNTNGATAVSVTNSGTLNISGGSYTGSLTETEYDRYVIGVKGGSTATINTIVTNGNGGVTVIGGSTANLTGGSYSGGKACGLYVAGASTVTYKDCTFDGVEGDVVVGGGTYGAGTINGETYTVYTKFNQVSTPEELKSIITNGGYAILADAIELNLATGSFLTIESGKTVTIDLNDKVLTTSSTPGDGTPDDITIKGTLTVKNGYVNTVNTAFFANGGKLTLTDCHVSTANTNGATAVSVTNSGTLNISGGSYKGTLTDTEYDRYVIGVKGSSTATINTTVTNGNGGVTVIGGSTANLTGGSYSGGKACGLYINQSSKVTYTDCSFSGGTEGAVVVGESGGTIVTTTGTTTYNGYTKIQ